MATDPVRTFDYIVVGAGSAGCVIAARLSEQADLRVLLLEAGGTDAHEVVQDPRLWTSLFPGPLDWGYQTVPQRHAAGRVVHCPRAKMIGGCHSHNASAWVHGHRSDFDAWACEGNPGWDYASVLPVFRKIEDFSGGGSDYRGAGGPMHVELPRNPNPIATAFLEAGREIGLPVIEDNNSGQMEGVSHFNLTILDGRRFSVAHGYLLPARERPTLTVVTHAETHRLLFEGTRCTGVEYVREGRLERAAATSEVVLSAGTIGSPRLLLLSGVGPAADLRALGIETRVDLPGVGRNLTDHILLAGLNYEIKGDPPPIRNNGAESTMWWRSDARLLTPDIQPVLLEFPFATEVYAPEVPPNSWAIAPGLVRPKSRGSVTLTSADPSAPLAIDPNYLACEADVQALLVAVEICREMGGARAFAEWRLREVTPGPLDRAEMREFVRRSTTTYFHPTSTCAMGRGVDAVVGPDLRVHGVSGLRVADASIMPDVTTGNTNAPSVMIGERAAELMLAEM
jgi:choline dehydrogenase